jgi:hypothetical protein
VLYAWSDTGRTILFDAKLLRAWFLANWPELKAQYGSKVVSSSRGNRTWRTECVFVPHRIVLRELARLQGLQALNWRRGHGD